MAVDILQDVSPAFGVFDRHDDLADSRHEQVVFCRDDASGLRAIIGIHDTTLGPALGGTRFYDYPSEAAALRDVLRLSEGMTSKAAAAGLPLGGGKAVIIGSPRQLRSPELLRAYGRFIESLGGRYVTAADVGTTADDLDIVAETTRYVSGRTPAAGGSGDSGLSTARGVFATMTAAATARWGDAGIAGRRVGIEGVGKVGMRLAGLLSDAGAIVSVCDADSAAVERTASALPDITVVESVIATQVDVYAPCALGGTLTSDSVDALRAEIVCGAANNQLSTGEIDWLLRERGILWVPDYVANAGGLIQVGSEFLGWDPDGVDASVDRIGDTVRELIRLSETGTTTTGAAAAAIVARRLAEARKR